MKTGKHIRFIVPYPPGQAPSQRFRFEQYIPFLKEQGYRVTVSPFLSERTWKTLYQPGRFVQKAFGILGSFLRRTGLLFRLKRSDILFIHREASHMGPPVFEWIIAKVLRRKYIYDFDDAIWLPNYSASNARFQKLKYYGKVPALIRWADRVSAGNAYLADYARQFNPHVTIIPTTIDTENLHTVMTDHHSPELVIGWTGTHSTMHYLDELIPVLEELEKTHRFTFLVISDRAPGYNTLKSLRFVPWNKETEIRDLATMQIGVMPLKADIWSEGKCGFKGLQYMALEIATVMSPVGVNTTIVQHGANGFLANTAEEWLAALKQLIEDPALREQLGKAGRTTVIDRYSVKSQQDRYLALIEHT